MKTPKKMISEEVRREKLINELEETVVRLHYYLRCAEEKEGRRFRRIREKIGKKGVGFLGQRDKADLIAWEAYKYYQGKFYAYLFVLQGLGQMELFNVIKRIRGLKYTENEIHETKFYPAENRNVIQKQKR